MSRTRRIGSLTYLLLVGILLLIVFVALGGIFDVDFTPPAANVDVQAPDVNVEPGRLPTIEVNPAG